MSGGCTCLPVKFAVVSVAGRRRKIGQSQERANESRRGWGLLPSSSPPKNSELMAEVTVDSWPCLLCCSQCRVLVFLRSHDKCEFSPHCRTSHEARIISKKNYFALEVSCDNILSLIYQLNDGFARCQRAGKYLVLSFVVLPVWSLSMQFTLMESTLKY